MIKTVSQLQSEYSSYRAPEHKIRRLADAGQLYCVKRGLYEDNRDCPGEALGSLLINGSCYLSFEYALARYSLIPEAVYVYTFASFRKKQIKEYHNFFGDYVFRPVPDAVFPYAVTYEERDQYSWSLALPEKALCDYVYFRKPIRGYRNFMQFLTEGLRVEMQDLRQLDRELLVYIAERYRSTNVRHFLTFARKEMN